jgi:hypothetical protein
VAKENAMSNEAQAPLPGPMSRRGKRVGVMSLRFPRLIKTLRVIAFASVVLMVCGGLYVRRAHSQLGEQLVDVGELLMQYDRAAHQDGTRTVLVNGQEMHFSSGMTPDDPHTVLEHFAAMCDSHDAGLVEQFTALPHRIHHRSGSFLDPVYRFEGPESGVVACLDMGEEAMSMRQLGERIDRFDHSHDVHDVGDIRYVMAQPADHGGTHFVTFWTDGSFDLDQVVPRDGHDAGGTDLEGVPRPPGAYRTMSASEAGNPDAAVQYMGSSMTEWELEHYYEQQLVAAGWTLVPVPEEDQPTELRFVEGTRNDLSEIVFVALDTDDHGLGTATIALSR